MGNTEAEAASGPGWDLDEGGEDDDGWNASTSTTTTPPPPSEPSGAVGVGSSAASPSGEDWGAFDDPAESKPVSSGRVVPGASKEERAAAMAKMREERKQVGSPDPWLLLSYRHR
jgi:hypothetical protein